MSTRVNGYCPMGCGPALVLSPTGEIGCMRVGCPRPGAAEELLGDQEAEHVVILGLDGFTLRHPLRERLDDALLDCDLHTLLAEAYPGDVAPGRYRVTARDGTWTWGRVS